MSEFLFKHCRDAAIDPAFGTAFSGPFTYHDPCHNLKSLKLQKEARHFLEQFGDRYRDDALGPVLRLRRHLQGRLSFNICKNLGKKKDKLDEIGANAVVTSCPGCYMQLKESLPIPVHFFSDIFKK